MLFNEKGNTLERFINEVNSEDRNVVLQFIHDVISWLKTRLKGEKVSFKIIRLENRFAAVLRNVDNTNAQKNNTTNDGDVQYLFAGQKSRTSNYSLLDQAIKLEDVGKATSEEIRQQTGWFRGYDGKWRYEINDRDIEVDTTGKFHTNPDIRRQTELFNKVYFDATATEDEIKELQILNKNLKGVIAAPQKLGQLIKHTKLFDAYPWLKDVNIRFEFISERGAYNPVFNEIVLSNHIKLNKEQLTKTLIHEIQHAIQHYEGFASGSNTEYWRNLGIDENELFKYYENTAGEIEARDAAIRWWRTNEARKEKRPDIDRTDVVFASNGSHWLSAKEAQYDPETASVSKQIKNSQDVLNRMNIVGSAVAPENFKTKYEAAQWAISQLKATGYQVDRQNFGKIYFEENDIRKGAEYADTYEEKAAFLLIPKVLKRGIEIGRHGNHKLRQKATVTFAAPVMLNGIRGNMAVVVNLNSNRYKVHRIILPDGTTFKFSTKKEVKQESYQGVTENSSLADTTSFTSNSRISQTNATVNNNISEDDSKYSIPTEVKDLLSQYDSGEISRDEYVAALDEKFGEAIGEYGHIPSGENAKNQMLVPKQVTDDKYTRRFIRTFTETGKLTAEMITDVEEQILLGETYSYKVVSDEKAQKYADTQLKNGDAETIWRSAVLNGAYNKNIIAVGEKLLLKAVESNDRLAVIEISAELAEAFTVSGQTVQAARLIKKMSGVGKLMTAQKEVKKINKDLQERYGDEAPTVQISPELARQLAETKAGEDTEALYQDVLVNIAQQVPATWLDKLNAWRYFAMLANPRTHIRNLVGNTVFGTGKNIKDILAAGIEHVAIRDTSKRTKAVFIKQEYKEFAEVYLKRLDTQLALSGNGQLDNKGTINQNRRIFKNEKVDKFIKKNSDLLELEDMLFKSIHFKKAFAGFLQARKVELKNIDEKVLEAASEYAIKEAKKATFQDESALANWLNSPQRAKAAKFVIEAELPFKRTPINIIKRGIEYSPLSVGKIAYQAFNIKNGKVTVSEFIDTISAGLTGTGIMALGMFLRSIGVVIGAFGDDEEDKYKKLNGEQEYSIEIFGHSYTIDWAAPSCIPFFIGVEIVDMFKDNDGFTLKSVADSFWDVLEPITELSMLAGVNDLITSVKYSEGNKTVSGIMGDVVTSFLMQLFPSALAATGRTIDRTQRTWYQDKNSPLDDFTQSVWNNVRSKVPGLSFTQSEKIDAWGNTVDRGSLGERLLENFVSPGYYSEIEYDEIDRALMALYDATGEKVFPQTAKKSFEVNGKTKYLTADEYETYAKNKGQMSYKYAKEFIESDFYKELDDAQRAEVIADLYGYANAQAKTTVSDYEMTSIYNNAVKYDKKGQLIAYYVYLAIDGKIKNSKSFNMESALKNKLKN